MGRDGGDKATLGPKRDTHQWQRKMRRYSASLSSVAARSFGVGWSGSMAGGRLPSFISVAISSKRALVELRLEAPMKGALLAEKPSVLPRPINTTGIPL